MYASANLPSLHVGRQQKPTSPLYHEHQITNITSLLLLSKVDGRHATSVPAALHSMLASTTIRSISSVAILLTSARCCNQLAVLVI